MLDAVKAKIFSKVACKRLLVGFSLSLLATCFIAAPAQAQFPYWYLGIGQSLLYPLTRGIGLPFYGPYSANPFYSTSSYLRRTAGRASQFPYIYPFNPNSFGPYGYRNAGMPAGNATQQPGDGMVDPNTGRSLDPDDVQNQGQPAQNGSAPNFYLPGPQSPNQSLYTQPSGGMAGYPQAVPGQNLNGQVMPSQAMLNQPMLNQPMVMPAQTDANGQPVMLNDPNSMPPKAPKHGRNKSKAAKAAKSSELTNYPSTGGVPSPAVPASTMATQSNLSQSSNMPGALPVGSAPATSSPLADGFIDHLVTKYDGHMGNALSNSDTRNWAKAMGLIDDQHSAQAMPADRIEVMGRILKDSSLDSVSKVDAMRILLKQKPASK
jgi:hypothetical protein